MARLVQEIVLAMQCLDRLIRDEGLEYKPKFAPSAFRLVERCQTEPDLCEALQGGEQPTEFLAQLLAVKLRDDISDDMPPEVLQLCRRHALAHLSALQREEGTDYDRQLAIHIRQLEESSELPANVEFLYTILDIDGYYTGETVTLPQLFAMIQTPEFYEHGNGATRANFVRNITQL
ncbi:MAG: hypothetical protein O3A01_07405 [bacterium]|nr:hypothetical protein [bacterium]